MSATTQAEQNALTLPQRAAVALGESANEAKLRELVAKSAGIISVTNPDGREEAHRAGMVLLKTRTGIEKTGKAAREDATAFSKAVIAMEKDLIGIIQPEETRVLALRDSWDEQIAAEKAARIAAERQRTEAIQAAIQAIRDIPISMAGKSSQDISHCIGSLVGTIPDEFYQEFIEQAQAARHESLDKLAAMETAQRAIEIEAESQRQEAARLALAAEEARAAEAARIAAEREFLAKERAAAAETARLAKIESDRVAAAQAAEAQRLADLAAKQEAEARRVQEQAAANLRAEREAQETAMRLERERVAAEQAKAAAELKAAQDAHDAKVAAHEAAVKLEADHAEGLADNAQFDADRKARREQDHLDSLAQDDAAADLARCTATAQAMLTNGRSLVQADADPVDLSLAALAEALDAEELTDEEISEMGREVGLVGMAWVERLETFCVHARGELMVAA